MKADFKNLYKQCLRIRLVEEKIVDLYPSDKIQSPVHLSIGQESVAVGLCSALENDDKVFQTYRSHAIYLAKGGCLKKMFAELFGKLDGISKGKAGSMHLISKDRLSQVLLKPKKYMNAHFLAVSLHQDSSIATLIWFTLDLDTMN